MPWRRMTMQEALAELGGIDMSAEPDIDSLRSRAKGLGNRGSGEGA